MTDLAALLADALHVVVCGGVIHTTTPCARGYADDIATYLDLKAGFRVTGEALFSEAEAPTSLLALADEWCDRTAPDDVARLNVRGFAIWADLRRKSGVRVTGEAEPCDECGRALPDHWPSDHWWHKAGSTSHVRVIGEAGLREALLSAIEAMDIVRDGLAVNVSDAIVVGAESILRHAAREARALLEPAP